MTSTGRRTLARSGAIALLAGALAASAPSIALGQATDYDRNCRPIPMTEDQQVIEQVCSAHAGCRFLVVAVVRKTCETVNFFRKLSGSMPPSGDLTNDQVLDVATPEFPRTTRVQQLIDQAKNYARSALGEPQRELVKTDDGRLTYVEAGRLSGGTKNGTLVYSDGTLARGQFNAANRLQGSGMLITPDGKVRAGHFDNDRLNGEGFVTDKDGGRTVLLEGTFDGDVPVGEVVRTYADGSKVREIWENGKMVARGVRVPRGQIPPPVQPRVDLASAPQAGDGLRLIHGTEGRRRLQLWCKGRLVAQSAWSPRSLQPEMPQPSECNATPTQYADVDDSERPDAIQRTLGRRQPGNGAPASTRRSGFPCPLGGAASIWDQLGGCMNEGQVNWGDSLPGTENCRPQIVAWSNYPGGQNLREYRFARMHLPWGAIRRDLLPLLSSQDVDYINRKLVDDRRMFIQQNYGNSGAWEPETQAYAQMQYCIGRAVMCRAGNSNFCS